MNRIHYLIYVILLLFTGISKAQPDTLQLDTGLIVGDVVEGTSVHVYKGIPYAAPPVGDLRWKPPQPPENWEGVYEAQQFSPVCMQNYSQKGSFYQKEFYQEKEPMSEDCLYLNVWTKSDSADKLRPVMMWIHGGAFSHGSASMPSFNGQAFAKKGVVLVSINYRLGIFGLFAHPDLTNESKYNSSGNYGLLDQIAALQWIQKNIEAFDGDPNNVTIFGQSSGAGNINKLMASPLAKNLFHKAILQSGSAYTFGKTQTLKQAEEIGKEVATQLNVSSPEELRSWSAAKLQEKASQFSFRPNIDAWFLPDEVFGILDEGRQHKIPILAGSNADEGSTLFGANLDADIFKNIIQKNYGKDAERFLDLYPHQTDQEAQYSFNKAWRDEMAWGAHTLVQVHTKTSGRKAWLYYFSKVPPGRKSKRYGAFHSAEIPYVFNSLDAVGRPWTKEDQKLAGRIMSYWMNFASKGNPNNSQLQKWPEYDPQERRVLELGNDIKSRVILEEDILSFYNDRFYLNRKQ